MTGPIHVHHIRKEPRQPSEQRLRYRRVIDLTPIIGIEMIPDDLPRCAETDVTHSRLKQDMDKLRL